jgi:hypothetical protein
VKYFRPVAYLSTLSTVYPRPTSATDLVVRAMDQTLHVGNDGMRDLLVDTQSRRIPSRIDTRSTPDPSRIVAGIAIIFAAYSVMMTPVRDTQLVIDRTTLYWGLLTLLVLAILFSSYLVG